ncbi:MAG: ATP-dependent DNA helicase RecG [Betaproteobacteria bacterium]|nr:ATP-dependent DNA helicase RecG [Betaproteobacteria bacterium]
MPDAPRAKSAPQKAMERLGLLRDIDLALHLPLRYEDETQLHPIAHTRDGQTAQVEGVVREAQVELRSRRQLVVRLADDSGEITLRFLNFYPSHQKVLARGQRVRVRGEVRGGFLGREMVHPTFKAVEPGAPLPASLTPVYPSSAQLPQVYLRKAITSAMARAPLDEVLPPAAIPAGLPPLKEAVRLLHQPPPGLPLSTLEDRSHPAWQRLKFDELLAQQLAQAQAVAARERLHAPVMAAATGPASLHARLRTALPFALTAAQARVCAEIDADLARPIPMHRLLQGDVGSGKTVVAALAAARAIDAGWQCALMAPTEILAEQHFHKLVQWLQPLGVTVAWLTGSRKGKARKAMLAQIASGEAGLVVGTHAVIQDDVVFSRLGLAVVDEQHRFGVAQRLELRHKLVETTGGALQAPQHGTGVERANTQAGAQSPGATSSAARLEPHLLTMSATPIPRTLAMTYFADLAVSTIDELPPGRTPIVTKVFADSKREQVIARIRDELQQGRQVYWVCPLIEESEALDLQTAIDAHAMLSAALSPWPVGLVHGRLPPAEKAATMAAFAAGELRVLVATTVIEVGVDVPNASLMVIEHAERFGLAQLHQLRGRVGRGSADSVCVLLYRNPLGDIARERLRIIFESQDGFEIARRDLQLRGPGELLGARQSGLPMLRHADLDRDAELVECARDLAAGPLAAQPERAAPIVARWLAGRGAFAQA